MRRPRADLVFLLAWLAAGSAAAADSPYRLRLADAAQYALILPGDALAARPYGGILRLAAQTHGLDPALLHAVVGVESGYEPRAVSPKGAVGLMQLMPATARRYGVRDRRDPQQNVFGGAAHLRELLLRFDHDLPLALAAYNAGEQAVRRHGRAIPPYRETRTYVPKVLEAYRENRRQAAGPYRLQADWAERLAARE